VSRAAGLLAGAVALLAAGRCGAQNLGHKLLGTLGLEAGAQQPTGIYVVNRFVFYRADELFDRNGNRVSLPLELRGVTDGVGVGGTYQVRAIATYVNASVAVPLSHVTGTVGDAQASIDRFGLADAYIQPLELGWHLPHLDLVTGYAFYVPTGRFEPGGTGGVSRGSWSHELSLGHALYFDRRRRFHLSALASWELNARKIGVDLTRGSTIQIQGGAGATLTRIVEVGVVGYGLWQVSDDSGSALPPVLRGARDRTYGVGAELDVTIAEVHSRIIMRWTHDVGSAARPQGQMALVGLAWSPWRAR
jgi:hypothetical protein